MNIAAAIDRIRQEAMKRPARLRAGYVFDNIEHQQKQANRYATMSRPPAGWTLSASEELISGLIALEAEFRGARVAA